ncbi:MAG: hypothetical protein MJ239_02555 [Bacilli bacterium]|nr:hypothetical protein [Bacilli bacterium]
MMTIYDGLTPKQEFNQWLANNGIWLAIGVAALIVIVVGAIFLSGAIKKKNAKPEAKPVNASMYMEALGGEDNVISKELRGSRIALVLKDYKAIDEAKLKEAGVDAIVMMSDKLTLVVKENAPKVFETLFGQNLQ